MLGGANGAAGVGGAGVVGASLAITNSGTITGGMSGDNAVQADAIDFTGGTNTLDLSTGTLSGNVGVDGTTTSLNFVQGAAATLANVITGTGSVIDSGAGTLTLSAANTYTGGTTVSAGELDLNHVTSGSIDAAGTGPITLSNGSLVSLVTGTVHPNLIIAANTTDTLAAAGGQTLTYVGDPNNQTVFQGALHIGTSADQGTVALDDADGTLYSLQGSLSIDYGTLRRVNGSLGLTLSKLSSVSVNNSAVFDLNDNSATLGNLQGVSTSADIALGTAAMTSLTLDAGNFAGAITGAGGVIIASGLTRLSGSNRYTGGTTLNAGTLELGQQTSAGTGGIAFAAGAQVLQLDATGTYTNAITSFSTDGDILDLKTINAGSARASYNGTTLTVSDGSNTDTLTINTAPDGYQYATVMDSTGGGGTDVVLQAIQASPPGPSTTPTPGPDSLTGSAGNDTIAGLAGDDTINGGGGNDFLLGNQGNDMITAGDGMNTVAGGMGDDRITVGNGANLLYGDEGADTITAGDGNNTIVGGTGTSMLDANDSADSITVGSGNDLVLGNQGADTINLGGGADTAFGGMGNDLITATGSGSDLLFGGEGSDTIQAGNGNNTLVGGSGNSAIDSLDGADVIRSGSGNDLILGNGGDDTVGAGAGNDTVVGGYGNDVLLGNQGDDFVLGNQGNDVIYGGFGDDTLVGGMGDDTLIGGQGNDVLYGNEGTNRFVFNAGDTDFVSGVGTGDAVMDFKSGTDALHFGSGPAGTAQNFGATSTASTSFAAIQALGQQLLNAGDTYAFVGSGGDGYLFTSAGNGGGTGIEDAVRLAGVKTPQAGDIA